MPKKNRKMEHPEGELEPEDYDSEYEEDENTEDSKVVFDTPCLSFRYMPCMAHTLQLVIKK